MSHAEIELSYEIEDDNDFYICLDCVIAVDFTHVQGSHSYHATSDLDFHGYSEIDCATIISMVATDCANNEIPVPEEYKNKQVSDFWSDDELFETIDNCTRFEAMRNGDFD
jgi:hypothetical protein